MPPKKKKNNTEQLIETIVEAILDKKGKEIVSLDMRSLKNSVTDYFVICHADNTRQVDAIADRIEELTLKNLNEKPLHKEGAEYANWILLDYVDVIVHVFNKEYRDFYNIEGLWGDAKRKEYETE